MIKFRKIVKKYINDDIKKSILLKMEKINYFEQFLKKDDKNTLIEILKMMEIRYYDNYESVFNYSEKPDGFFIILKGNVEIFKPKNKYLKIKNNLKNNFQYVVNKAVYFEKWNHLNEGESFGNLALLNESKRSASVFAYKNEKNKKIILGFIRKNLFKSFLANLEYKKLNKKIEILKYFFKNKLKITDYYEMVNKFELNYYSYNDKIIIKNKKFDKIIFIYQGKCQLIDHFEQKYDNKYKKKFNNVVRILREGDIIGINEYKKNLMYYEYEIISKSSIIKTLEISINKFKDLIKKFIYIKFFINNNYIPFNNYKERKLKIIKFWKKRNFQSLNQINISENSNKLKNKLDKYNIEKNVFKLENFLKKNFNKIKDYKINIDFNKYNKIISLDNKNKSLEKITKINKINEIKKEEKSFNYSKYKINIFKKKLKNYKIIRNNKNPLIYNIKTSFK